jgi:hypothetical protein
LPRAVSSYDTMRTDPSGSASSISATVRPDRREGSSYQGSVRSVWPTPAHMTGKPSTSFSRSSSSPRFSVETGLPRASAMMYSGSSRSPVAAVRTWWPSLPKNPRALKGR